MVRYIVASVLRINAVALVLVAFTNPGDIRKRSFGKVAAWFGAPRRHIYRWVQPRVWGVCPGVPVRAGLEVQAARPAPQWRSVGYPIRAQLSIPASLWGNVGLSPNLSPNRAANDR